MCLSIENFKPTDFVEIWHENYAIAVLRSAIPFNLLKTVIKNADA
jgi:hypothetical protein